MPERSASGGATSCSISSGSRGLGDAPRRRALGRPAAARRARARARLRADGAPARRALRRARREDPRAAPAEPEGAAQRLGVTTILVTHDQEEAFELADRVGVIERGRLLEVGHARGALRAAAHALRRDVPGRRHDARRPLPRAPGLARAPEPSDSGGGSSRRGRSGPGAHPPGTSPPPEGRAASGAAVLGQGEIIEQSFSGATRRTRVRLPPLPGVRQVVPPLPYGEETPILDVALAPHESTPQRPWVVSGRLAHPPTADSSDPGLRRRLGDRSRARVRQAAGRGDRRDSHGSRRRPDSRGQDLLRDALATRVAAAGLTGATIRVRRGETTEQIALEEREAPYDFVVVGAPQLNTRLGRRRPNIAEELLRGGGYVVCRYGAGRDDWSGSSSARPSASRARATSAPEDGWPDAWAPP